MTNQIGQRLKSGQGIVASGELIIIRHGRTVSPETLNGRTDVGLAEHPGAVTQALNALWVSPAIRARDTAKGLFPNVDHVVDARLWEQDFGVLDGKRFSDLPDIGSLSKSELAALKADGGESFHDMAARVEPALREAALVAREAEHPVAIVAHAGVVRVALAMAMESATAALAFQVAYLGATRLTCYEGGFAITAVNETLA